MASSQLGMMDADRMEAYQIIGKVGEGTFGEVYKAKHKQSGRVVALKKIRIRKLEEGIPKSLIREIQALEHVQHPNVIELFAYFPVGSSIVLTTEFMVADLYQIMRCLGDMGKRLPEPMVKTIMLMLLQGVDGLHESKIMHRDLKPANVLFDATGVLKIGDFGLARVHDHNHHGSYSHEVATRWYRSPELLYGARQYDPRLDIWAVGCIFAELLDHSPLFPGENDIDQLYRVFKIMGTPNLENWPECEELPDYHKISFPPIQATPLERILPDAPAPAINLLKKMLTLSPDKRISAKKALLDPYFLTEPLPLHPSELASLVALPFLEQEAKKAKQARMQAKKAKRRNNPS